MAVELRGRPTVASLTVRLAKAHETNANLRDDLTAARGELAVAGRTMEAAARRIEYAMTARRPDLVLHVAGQLGTRGKTYSERAR